MTPRLNRAWMAALCAVVGCTSSDPPSQVVTGRIDGKQGAVAVRAVVGGEVATAAQVRSDGSFTLVLPAGERYRLEVLTRSGVKHLVTRDGTNLVGVSFEVCAPVEPFSFGTVGDPGTTGMCTDPMDPNCMPPPPCDPTTDPSCQPPPPCQPGDPNCPPPPCMDPTDPNCMPPPPPCDPTTDPSCPPPPPPPCDPTDPMCNCMADGTCCQPGDPSCPPPPPPPCDPATDPNCKPEPWPCDPTDPMCDCMADGTCGPACTDPTQPGCAPPCTDPMDPGTCQDPCSDDPTSCGCMPSDPNCWGEPPTCDDAGCAPGDAVMPEHAPADFGCQGSDAS